MYLGSTQDIGFSSSNYFLTWATGYSSRFGNAALWTHFCQALGPALLPRQPLRTSIGADAQMSRFQELYPQPLALAELGAKARMPDGRPAAQSKVAQGSLLGRRQYPYCSQGNLWLICPFDPILARIQRYEESLACAVAKRNIDGLLTTQWSAPILGGWSTWPGIHTSRIWPFPWNAAAVLIICEMPTPTRAWVASKPGRREQYPSRTCGAAQGASMKSQGRPTGSGQSARAGGSASSRLPQRITASMPP